MALMGVLPGAIAQGLIFGIMALGVFITYRILDFSDLTVDGSFALGNITGALLISLGYNPFLAMLGAVIGGMLSGMATGILHTVLGIPGILSSILVQLALYSVTLRVGMGRSNIPIMNNPNNLVTQVATTLGVSRDIGTLIVGAVVCGIIIGVLYWYFGTEVGSAIRATGNNANMARALGVNTSWMIMLGLMISNGLVGLSGALFAQAQRSADITIGAGTIIIGLASVVIGSAVIKSTENFALRMFSTVVGSVIYQIITAFVLQLGLNTNDLKAFSAIIVVIALSFPTFRQKCDARRKAKEAAKC